MPLASLPREPTGIVVANVEDGCTQGSEISSVSLNMFMKRIIGALIVWVLVGSTAEIGLCEPSSVGPGSGSKSVTGTTPSSVPPSPSEKAGDVSNKHSATAEDIMGKLSNAVSSEY